MLHKTDGISLGYFPYKETSVISKIYTEEFGLQSYLVNGVRTAKGKQKSALFQPLTILELVVYQSGKSGLQRISEMKCKYAFQSIPFDYYKISISLFLSEVLQKVLTEGLPDQDLFQFIESQIFLLDKEPFEASFHLKFLFKLLDFLGIHSTDENELLSQSFSNNKRESLIQLTKEEKFLFEQLHKNNGEFPKMDRITRLRIVDFLLNFYCAHYPNMESLKSLQVLREIMS